MRGKVVYGVMLTLLLMGMLTLVINIQLVKANESVTSGWLSFPVIFDGRMTTAEEWSDAIPVDLTLLERHVGPGTVSARVWIKNDNTWLYMLYRVEWFAGDIDPFDGGFVQYFWDWIGEPPPLWAHSDLSFIEFDNATLDLYGWDETRWYNDVDASPPGENNVEGAATHDGTYYWFEFGKELDSSDGYDWIFTPGQVKSKLLVNIWDDSTGTPYGAYVSLYISTPTPPPRVVHNIDTGLDYAWIQAAIDAPETSDGHTILVDAGIYYENVFLDKSLTLIGEDSENTIVDGCGNGHVIEVTADNVKIDGFTLQNGWGGVSLLYSSGNTISGNIITLNGWSGIEQYHSNNNIIYDNKVTLNSHAGIWLVNSSNNAITYSNVSNNIWQGIFLGDSSDDNEVSNNMIIGNDIGILLESAYNNLLSSNAVGENIYGISLQHSSNYNNLDGNAVVSNVDVGILLVDSDYNEVSDNAVNDNGGGGGITLASSNCNSVSDNVVSENLYDGILLVFSNDTKLEENTVTLNHDSGIRMHGSNRNTIGYNTITSNGWCGIHLHDSSGDNKLEGNIVTSNLWSGIFITESNQNSIEANTVKSDFVGIYLWRTSYHKIESNKVTHGDYGIAVEESEHTTIERNMALVHTKFDLYWDMMGAGNVWEANKHKTRNW